jgi:hypothetical protein
MTKKLSIAGLVVAAAASSAFAFGAAPAKAACLVGGSTVCTTFDPSSASSVTSRTGFIGTQTPSTPYNKARVAFRVTGTGITLPTITGISLTGDGISTSLNAFGPLSITSLGTWIATPWLQLTGGSPTGSLASLDYALSSLSFTIPALTGAVSGNTVEARIQYIDNDETQLNTSGGNFLTTADVTPAPSSGVPGPLPLLGAGAAFGFSRSMRRRIAQSV